MIERSELFSRLREGPGAGLTVVSPNNRLAQALVSELDALQSAAGRTVWEAPDILPLAAFVERLWEDALYSDLGEELPLLLGPVEEQHLWEDILSSSGLLLVAQAASECRQAWRVAHAWRIRPGGDTEDTASFAGWCAEYRRRTAGAIDAARLPDLVAELLPRAAMRKPKAVVAYGFDVLTPQVRSFLQRLEQAGSEVDSCAPQPQASAVARFAFESLSAELEAAAGWARARHEAGAARIGVVVPDLALRRNEVRRVFSRTLSPGAREALAAAPLPFNVSLGAPLGEYPLVHAALSILELALGEVDFERASRLIRSPFIGEAGAELASRARLDAGLRRTLGPRVTLGGLVAASHACPLLQRRLERLSSAEKPDRQSPYGWARTFTTLLEAAGFPGERAADSAEFQARGKLNEALAGLARLERVAPRLSFAQALAALGRICSDTLFQPESPEAPIQVLGVLESAGLGFDCLWVSGLSDEAWPLEARPSPFLSLRAQKAAGVPEASAQTAYALDARITDAWRGAASEVIFSHAARDGDRELAPSALVSDVPESPPPAFAYPRYRDAIFGAARLEELAEERAPALAAGRVRGGTRVLADQAACPFRAFARHRLRARALESPGDDAAARRGSLLHALMKHLWGELGDSASLVHVPSSALARAAASAVKEAKLEGRLAAIEQVRLEKLGSEWLEVEKGRSPFHVAALEEPRALHVGELEFSGRIDRMDRLEDGTHVLIDYKSGQASRGAWLGARPEEPQLPVYAITAAEDVSAVAFARLKPGGMRFVGYAREDGLLPGVDRHPEWEQLLASWKREIALLGEGFRRGEATVDPKNGLETCRLCDLQTLCRVYERLSALSSGEAEADGEVQA